MTWRGAVDAFAARSATEGHRRHRGRALPRTRSPIQVPQRKGELLELPLPRAARAGTTVGPWPSSPAFRKDGSVTAGNASSLNDGAAAVLLR
ncbi:hypothetical protein P4234_28165 [Pseudomonas aeruginosa]|nr:hypothetical protein [Pseudomonas aeruginosa]